MKQYKYTKRGFRNYSEQKDSYGIPFRLQQSSSAMIDACWLFIDDPECTKPIVGGTVGPVLHLNRNNARRLIAGLRKFLNHE